MRTTSDLIDELKAASATVTKACIAVGFEKRTEFVWDSKDADPLALLAELESLIRAGGEPIAIVGFTLSGREATFYTSVLEEYRGEDWVDAYLNSLMAVVRRGAEAMGARTFKAGKPENN